MLPKRIAQAIVEETFKSSDSFFKNIIEQFTREIIAGQNTILRPYSQLTGLIYQARTNTFFLATFLGSGLGKCPVYNGEWSERMRRKFGRFAQFWHICGPIEKIYEDFNLEGGPRIV